MHALRRQFRTRPVLVLAILAAALLLRALIPAGTMLQTGNLTLSVTMCADATGGVRSLALEIPREPGNPGDGAGHDASKGHCAFSVLTLGMLEGAAPFVLAALLAAFALALLPAAQIPLPRWYRATPPSRAPPAII